MTGNMNLEELQTKANPTQSLLAPKYYMFASQERFCGAREILWVN